MKNVVFAEPNVFAATEKGSLKKQNSRKFQVWSRSGPDTKPSSYIRSTEKTIYIIQIQDIITVSQSKHVFLQYMLLLLCTK